tara:strand:+ start:2436 stop:3296 length:861 start_codon:yes stop_codon:yes gene_type:complete
MEMKKKIQKLGVIGSGTMGSGIAHVSALSGFRTILIDINKELLSKSLDSIQKNLNNQMNNNQITQTEMNLAIDKIQISTDLSQVKMCDLVIEAITEDQKIKSKLFSKLDKICKESSILASNTSSISISGIGESTNRPDRVIGMHFMNPVHIMKLVEVIRGKQTSKLTASKILKISKSMNKIPIECNDSPGFLSNRILMPMINEAIFCLYEKIGSKEAIDSIMKLGMSHPMGPLALADLIGLDVCLNIINVLYSEFKDEKYMPCPLLIEMVDKGRLGKKSGQGFYNY